MPGPFYKKLPKHTQRRARGGLGDFGDFAVEERGGLCVRRGRRSGGRGYHADGGAIAVDIAEQVHHGKAPPGGCPLWPD